MYYRTITQIEETVLGCCIQVVGSVELAQTVVNTNTFLQPENRALWHCLQEMHKKRQPIDILTVIHRLEGLLNSQKQPLKAYFKIEERYRQFREQYAAQVARKVDRVVDQANLQYYCFVLVEAALRRQLFAVLSRHDKGEDRKKMLDLISDTTTDVITLLNALLDYNEKDYALYEDLLKVQEQFDKKVQKIQVSRRYRLLALIQGLQETRGLVEKQNLRLAAQLDKTIDELRNHAKRYALL
ncbi:DnaB-like helicase N-terminal domain-containing protein [Rapidithrix thailandica]|uniref:DnaB-like helicase N-terminal domain-containing protein n=1 Tax=Rapidithrix thailandica TaxID=413964 RepID=A0AAW9S4D8_9BACT